MVEVNPTLSIEGLLTLIKDKLLMPPKKREKHILVEPKVTLCLQKIAAFRLG